MGAQHDNGVQWCAKHRGTPKCLGGSLADCFTVQVTALVDQLAVYNAEYFTATGSDAHATDARSTDFATVNKQHEKYILRVWVPEVSTLDSCICGIRCLL